MERTDMSFEKDAQQAGMLAAKSAAESYMWGVIIGSLSGREERRSDAVRDFFLAIVSTVFVITVILLIA